MATEIKRVEVNTSLYTIGKNIFLSHEFLIFKSSPVR